MGIVLAIIIFSFIIFFHEFGHFVLAKLNHIDVEEFSLGMGPCLISRTYHGTKYSLRLILIGGYCSMEDELGESEEDEESEEEADEAGESEEARLPEESEESEEVAEVPGPSPNGFNSKSVWARMSVVLAGPAFNFILAYICAVVLVFLAGVDRPIVAAVTDGYPAQEAGIEAGDTITKMGGSRIHIFRQISTYNQFHQGETTEITYVHDGEERTVIVSPLYDEELDYYYFGISGGGYTKATFWEGFQYGVYEVEYWITSTIESLGMLITGQVGLDQLSGPVGIVSVVDESYNVSREYGALAVVEQMLYLVILLSANLGVMNLLPIPALDGGRFLFLIIEKIRGKKIKPETEGAIDTVGFVLVMLLMVFVCVNDVRNLFF